MKLFSVINSIDRAYMDRAKDLGSRLALRSIDSIWDEGSGSS